MAKRILIIVTMLLISCGSPQFQREKLINLNGKHFHSLCIIGYFKEDSIRRKIESSVAGNVIITGMRGVPGFDVLPELKGFEFEDVRERMRLLNIEGFITIRGDSENQLVDGNKINAELTETRTGIKMWRSAYRFEIDPNLDSAISDYSFTLISRLMADSLMHNMDERFTIDE